MTVRKIISGGQTGADQGGLAAGKALGLETGGTAPLGYRTDAGAMPSLGRDYGLGEDASYSYPPRTRKNVQDSDGTVIFGNTSSPGSKMTAYACIRQHKPYIPNPTPQVLRAWCEGNSIEILNVAGNRERTNPGMFQKTKDTLIEAFGEPATQSSKNEGGSYDTKGH